MFEDYSTKKNALEVFFTWFLFSPGDKIQNLDKTIMLNNVSMIEAWAMDLYCMEIGLYWRHE